MPLHDHLLTAERRPRVVSDCIHLIDEEVDRKGGLSGFALKAAFKAVKAVKPGFIAEVTDGLLPEWVEKLEAHFARWEAAGKTTSFGQFCARDAATVAERLLEVTDARARKGGHRTVLALYEKLRSGAKEHVIAAVPGLGRVVDRNIP
ncbi:MAG: hypothetical protein EXR79_12175 [Myxococcales bacterium]|nr:hypothetical protein [Myxococcales bacterium]